MCTETKQHQDTYTITNIHNEEKTDNFRIGKGHWIIGAGAGIAHWLERRTRHPKVAGSSPDRSSGRIFARARARVCVCVCVRVCVCARASAWVWV